MLAVASLMGLLLAGFALDGGIAEEPEPQDAPGGDGPDAETSGDLLEYAGYQALFGEDPAPEQDETANAEEVSPMQSEGWVDLYGSDGADQLYGGTALDGLFASAAVMDAPAPQSLLDGEAAEDDMAAEDPLFLPDFELGEDRLVLGVAAGDEDAEVEVRTYDHDGHGRISEVCVAGEPVCRVPLFGGAAPLTEADIALVPESDLAALEQA